MANEQQNEIERQRLLIRDLLQRPAYCRGVASQIQDMDGAFIRDEQGGDERKRERKTLQDLVNRLECRQEVDTCFERDEANYDTRLTELQRKNEDLETATRYALATFRALDQYTFDNSDHALLITEAVKKLERLTNC